MNEQPDSKPRRPWVKRLMIAAGVLVLIVLLIGGYFYLRVTATPEMWKKEQQRIAKLAPSQKQAVAESLRNRLVHEWTADAPSEEFEDKGDGSFFGQRRRFAIPYDQLNVWLDVEGRSLLESLGISLPANVQNAMVSGNEQGNLIFAIKQGTGGSGRVFTLTFDITVADDGTVTSELLSAKAGKMSVSADTAVQMLNAASNTSGDQGNLLNALLTGKPVPPRDLPIDPGENGIRDGRIVGMEVDEQQITVTRQTVRRPRESD